MKRFECMQVMSGEIENELVVVSLGGSVDEWYNAAPQHRERTLFHQHLGTVMPVALGLTVGLPHRRVIALDTDGGLLLNLGILATVGNEAPKNLVTIVWDNESYVSIGGIPTHTSGRTDLEAIAKGCGIDQTITVRSIPEFEASLSLALTTDGPHFIVAKVEAVSQPGLIRKTADGREHKYIFVRNLEREEGTTILGPSSHN